MRRAEVERIGAAVEHAHASSRARRPGRSRAPTCAAPRSGRRTARRPCRSAAGSAPASRSTNAPSTSLLAGVAAVISAAVEQPARIAVGEADQARSRVFDRVCSPVSFAARMLQVFGSDSGSSTYTAGARQQRAVHLERRVLGGGADERDQAALDERQERVLLRLVEAVHFVDEQDGVAARARERRLGLLHRLADVLHAGEHRGERDELGVEGLRHQARERGLARRPAGPTGSSSAACRTRTPGAAACPARAGGCWPTTSSSACGRSASASGAAGSRLAEQVAHMARPGRRRPCGGLKRNSAGVQLRIALQLGEAQVAWSGRSGR